MWRVFSLALSIVIKVYWQRFLRKSDADKEKLWEKIGKKFRQTLFELEGLLIKIGQMLSIRADLLPNSFIKEIQQLVDQVPPSPWEDIKAVLEREWNGNIEENLLSIETKAIASASIGEVYRGWLKDGKKVAIKVQRPTIQAIVRTDFQILAVLFWFVRIFAPIPKDFLNFPMLYKELKHVMERELDFQRELKTAISFSDRFQQDSQVIIPHVYTDLCTSHVLVMEWVDGERITNIDFLNDHQIDRVELAQQLMKVFLPQWLQPGVFHADPHSGNVLVNEDGKLILLDFGMVGEISKKDATEFQNLVESFLMKDHKKAVEVLRALGFLLPSANTKSVEPLIEEAFSINFQKIKEMDLFAVKKELNDLVRTLPIQVPTRFIFLGRSVVTIEGMLYTLVPNEELHELAKPVLLNWINESELSKWKLLWKWLNAQPFTKIITDVLHVIKTPQRYVEWKENEQQRNFQFIIYENQKKQMFMLGCMGLIGVFIGTYLNQSLLWQGATVVIGLSALGYIVSRHKQKKV